MELRFVNHASVRLDTGQTRLLSDPWYRGSVFDDGWNLVVEDDADVAALDPTQLWISHEHPDHFSPAELAKVPEAARAALPVLFQETADRKVLSWLRAKGFAARELAPGEALELEPGVRVRCGKVGFDSWLLLEAEGLKVLNLNDCLTDLAAIEAIREAVGEVDVVLTQFSHANWAGNPEDDELLAWSARAALAQVLQQVRVLRPRWVVPFASFVWFSHPENVAQNRYRNDVGDVADAIAAAGATPVVLYPGETWRVGEAHDSAASRARWRAAHAALPAEGRPREAAPVPWDALQADFAAYVERLRAKNDWDAIVALELPPARVYLWDLGCAARFDVVRGLERDDAAPEACDLQLGSSSLAYVLRHEWGRGTLCVNGRFRARYASVSRFFSQTQIAYANNIGHTYPAQLTRAQVLEPSSWVARVAALRSRGQLPAGAL